MLSYCLTVMPVSHDIAECKQGTEQNKVQIWVKMGGRATGNIPLFHEKDTHTRLKTKTRMIRWTL